MFKVGDEIDCVITEIDKEKEEWQFLIDLQLKILLKLLKKFPVGTIVNGEVVNKNEYSLFVKIENLDVDAFLHCNDLSYLNNGEEELNKYKKGDKIKVKSFRNQIFRSKSSSWFKTNAGRSIRLV